MGSGWKSQNPIRNSLAPQWAVERQRLENRVGRQWLENTSLALFAALISLKEDNISLACEKIKSSLQTSPSWSYASAILGLPTKRLLVAAASHGVMMLIMIKKHVNHDPVDSSRMTTDSHMTYPSIKIATNLQQRK